MKPQWYYRLLNWRPGTQNWSLSPHPLVVSVDNEKEVVKAIAGMVKRLNMHVQTLASETPTPQGPWVSDEVARQEAQKAYEKFSATRPIAAAA